tara:strand:- start:287 stop:520 length:234 start_codon:yes stop_codon:yes gene_type:complete
MNEDEYREYESKERRQDKAASYDRPMFPNKQDELIKAFRSLLDWYGGVTEFEANMGSFWWTNEHGTTYTMIVHETKE